jgi:hypothetical protein
MMALERSAVLRGATLAASLGLTACSGNEQAGGASTGAGGAGLGDGGSPSGGGAGTGGSAGGAAGGEPTGHIRVDVDYPHAFQYDGGAHFFPLGDTAYYLLGESQDTIDRYLDSRAEHSFNLIRFGAVAPGFWPFGGTPASPDFATIDEVAMQKLDAVFDEAAARGIKIELILWLYDAEGGNGMWGDSELESSWVDTVVGRYRDRTNLFMWTVTNEFERYPTGAYSYEPSDVDWARSVAAHIVALDPIHAVGVHPSVWITDAPPYLSYQSYQGVAQHHPPVVWPLWEGSAASVYNTQNNEGVQIRHWDGNGLTYETTDWQGVTYPATWTAEGWDFEGPGMEDSIAEDWSHGRPVVNTEFGYQYEEGVDNFVLTTHQLHSRDTVRRKAWKIATAGGYFCMGFAHTAVVFDASRIDTWRPEQLEVLYDFFVQRTEYWTMAPHLESVASFNALLARPGAEYVAYFPRGGTNEVDLEAGTYAVQWLDPVTGGYSSVDPLTTPGGAVSFTCPGDGDWVLHLTATGQRSAVTSR